jgi:hypothetical protein
MGQEGGSGNEQESTMQKIAGDRQRIASGHEQRDCGLGEDEGDQQRNTEFGERGQGKGSDLYCRRDAGLTGLPE